LVFLDEPTAGMDPQARATTWELVREIVEQGTTVVLTTHLLDEAERLCDRVAIVAAGTLAALGTPHQLTSSNEHPEIRFETNAAIDIAKLASELALDDDAVVEERTGVYRLQVAANPLLIAHLAQFLGDLDVTLTGLEAGRRSLEDVFLQLVAEERPS
jgi:ABC-2 type transport system ATP-binding protein